MYFTQNIQAAESPFSGNMGNHSSHLYLLNIGCIYVVKIV